LPSSDQISHNQGKSSPLCNRTNRPSADSESTIRSTVSYG